jgi:hypothetical protein
LHTAIFDLGQSAAGFLFPGLLILGIDAVRIFGESVNQFTNLFRRPVAGFFNDLFQCQWHGLILQCFGFGFNLVSGAG